MSEQISQLTLDAYEDLDDLYQVMLDIRQAIGREQYNEAVRLLDNLWLQTASATKAIRAIAGENG